MVNLLTQTVGKCVGNGNSQIPSQEGKIPSQSGSDAQTFDWQFHPWFLPQRNSGTYIQGEMYKNVHCTISKKK